MISSSSCISMTLHIEKEANAYPELLQIIYN